MKSFKTIEDWIRRRKLFAVCLDSVELDHAREDSLNQKITGLVKEIRGELSLPDYNCTINCHVDCGVPCCFFSPLNIIEGVLIRPAKLQEIESIIKGSGKKLGEYVTFIEWDSLPPRQQEVVESHYNIADYLLEIDGVRKLVSTKKSDHPISQYLLRNAPKSLRGLRLWLDRAACSCSFLKSDNKCLLHGHDLTPKTCLSFVCTTGYVIYILESLNILSPSETDGLDLARLNELAKDATILLAEKLLTSEFLTLEQNREKGLIKILFDPPEDEKKLLASQLYVKDLNLRHMQAKEKICQEIRETILSLI
ncbi:MAG: hypothetical protein ABH851_04600 [Methanobacteriota archaeon]